MVSTLGIALGVTLTLVVVVVHYASGTEYDTPDDIAQEVLEHRAATVRETAFPEPASRAIGGGGAAGAIAGGEGESGGELAEGEADEAAGEDPSAIPDDEAETYEIEYVKEGETLEVKENETLLEAGEDEGWDLPYACREGQCLSCGGHVADGGNSEDYLVHHTQEMLNEEELGEGYTLTCVAYPTADFSLETNETP